MDRILEFARKLAEEKERKKTRSELAAARESVIIRLKMVK